MLPTPTDVGLAFSVKAFTYDSYDGGDQHRVAVAGLISR